MLLLGVAATVTVINALQLHALWNRLPANSAKRVDWEAVARARSAWSGRAYEGWVLATLSNHVTDARHRPQRIDELLEDTRAGVTLVHRTQVARLQLASLTLLQLERGGAAVEHQWQRVLPYLEGLDHAVFEHGLADLIDAETLLYQNAGVSAGAARRWATGTFGYAHGPFLQEFVGQMRRIGNHLGEAGDADGAALCARVTLRLLRQWVLEPGPAGLRLLAADLLAEYIAAVDAVGAPPTLAAKLQSWRTAYRAGAAARPVPPAAIRLGNEPVPAQAASSATSWLGFTIWCTAALIPVVLIGLLTIPGVFKPVSGGPHRGARRFIAATPAVLVLLIGWAVIASAPDLVHDALQRIVSDGLGWPRMVFVAGGTAILFVALSAAALTSNRKSLRSWIESAAHTVLVSWLLLSVAGVAVTVVAGRAYTAYDRALAAPWPAQTAAIADPNAAGLLDELRAWEP